MWYVIAMIARHAIIAITLRLPCKSRQLSSAYNRHSLGTPLSACVPRSENFRLEPPTRSFTVLAPMPQLL